MVGGDFTEALAALEEDLNLFTAALESVEGITRHYQIQLLSTVKIYLNDGIIFGKPKQSRDWSGSVFHPGRPWLAENGNLRLVEFYFSKFTTTSIYIVIYFFFFLLKELLQKPHQTPNGPSSKRLVRQIRAPFILICHKSGHINMSPFRLWPFNKIIQKSGR